MPSVEDSSSKPEDKCSPQLRAAFGLSSEALHDLLGRAALPEGQSRFLDLVGTFGPTTAAAEPAATVRARGAPAPLFGLRIENGQVIASVIFEFRGDWSSLDHQGVEYIPIADEFATADIPLESLRALLRNPGLISVELADPVTPMLDKSVYTIGGHAFPPPDWSTSRGEVIIGVIELEPLDFHHQDFCILGSSGPRTRVAYLWDQSQDPANSGVGKPPMPYKYGLEYTSDELNMDLSSPEAYSIVRSRPPMDGGPNGEGHGTHVTGIAAGNGNARFGMYTGVAPRATIAYVNIGGAPGVANNRSIGFSTRLLNAVQYLVDRAGKLPCVVNISLGISSGSRNGTSLLERALDRLVGNKAGRIIVAAAGNDGCAPRAEFHATGSIAEGQSVELEVRVRNESPQDHEIEIWYQGDSHPNIAIIDPRGTRFDGTPDTAKPYPYTVSIHYGRDSGGTLGATLLFSPKRPGGRLAAGIWTLELKSGEGGTKRSFLATIRGGSDMRFLEPATASTMTSPSTANRVIAVANANHNTKSLSAICSSGRGPRWDGYQKPEIAAPGVSIFAPSSNPSPADGLQRPYSQKTGTSMAAPHVAGAIALLLQLNPGLETETTLKLLKQHARLPDDSNGWNRGTGYGCLQLQGIGLEEVMQISTQTTSAKISPIGLAAAPDMSALQPVQIDFGNYVLRQLNQIVGRVLVQSAQVSAPATGDDSSAHAGTNCLPADTIEHWCLYSSYRPPRSNSGAIALEFTYEDCSADPEEKGTLEGFLRHIQATQGAQYIQSICAVRDPTASSS